MADYLGLIFELLFLLAGIYIYLLARGAIKGGIQTEFVKQNRNILRVLSIALIAIMSINVILHLSQLVS